MTTKKKTTKRTTKKSIPIILCAGENGRAVIYGRVSRKPTPGKPVTLTNARMVLYWSSDCGGLFGLATKGPKTSTRITQAVPETMATQWKEYVECTAEAAEEIEAWKAA